MVVYGFIFKDYVSGRINKVNKNLFEDNLELENFLRINGWISSPYGYWLNRDLPQIKVEIIEYDLYEFKGGE